MTGCLKMLLFRLEAIIEKAIKRMRWWLKTRGRLLILGIRKLYVTTINRCTGALGGYLVRIHQLSFVFGG
jgi:hypothetical protein